LNDEREENITMHYKPIDSTKIPRFAEVRTFMRLPNVCTTSDIDYAVVGIPFDTGTTYRPGARFGPDGIRTASAIIKPYNYVQDVNVAEILSGVDYGDVPVVTGYIEDTYEKIFDTFLPIVEAGVVPIGMGGDHSVTLGELRAIAKKHGPVALVQFDSHTDTVDSYFGKKYGHGTPFKRALDEGLLDVEHSIQLGMRQTFYTDKDVQNSIDLGFELLTSFEMHQMSMPEIIERVKNRVGDAKAFLTFDIDFADPAYAPGTGTPEIGGFTSYESISLVQGLRDLNFIGFDVVEVLPYLDNAELTSLLAGNLMFEYISILARKKKGGK
jgi:agmatinase